MRRYRLSVLLLVLMFLSIGSILIDQEMIQAQDQEKVQLLLLGDHALAGEAQRRNWTGNGTSENPYLIQNMNFETNWSGVGIYLEDISRHVIFRNCTISDDWNVAFTVLSGNIYAEGCSNLTFEGCTIYSGTNQGGRFESSRNISFKDCHIESLGEDFGISFYFCSDITIMNCTLGTPSNYILYFTDTVGVAVSNCQKEGFGPGIAMEYVLGSSIKNVTFDGSSYYPVRLAYCEGIDVSDNTFINVNDAVIVDFLSRNCTFQGNSITEGFFGIYSSESDGHRFINNSISSYWASIYLTNGRNASFIGNRMTNSSLYIRGSTEVMRSVRVVRNNTVNGLPLIYLKDMDVGGKEVQEDVGCIFLVNVSNARITGRIFNNTYIGITIIGSRSVMISNCDISNSKSGVVCKYSRDISIESTELTIQEIGIQFTECEDSVIRNNEVHGGYYGIYLDGSDGNLIDNNQLQSGGGGHGIISSSDDNIITNNMVQGDLVFDYSFRNTIENNQVMNGDLHLSEEILWDHRQPEPKGNIVGNLTKEFYLHRSGENLEIPDGTDWIVLFNLSRCSVSNFSMEEGHGIEALFCNDLTISDTTLSSTLYGIEISNSVRTDVINCDIRGANAEGIKISSSESCRVRGNNIVGMSRSIEISQSNGVEIVENSILNSRDNSITIFENSHDTMVLRNEINNSDDSGIRIRDSYENLISGNRIDHCDRYGIELSNGADRNMIYNNRFSYNHDSLEVFHDLRRQASDDGQDNSWYFEAPGVSIGNYWLDLQTPDENEDGRIDIQYQMDGYRMNYDLYPMVVDHEEKETSTKKGSYSELYLTLFFIGIILWLGILVVYKILKPSRD